jgi:hypothetical protein
LPLGSHEALDLPTALSKPVFDVLERNLALAAVRRALFDVSSPVRLDRFELQSRIGSGAMGVVYAAHDPDLDRPVALKVLDPGDASDHARERLLREAKALARLSHPNVVAVHDVGSDEGRVYIAMELVEGDSLDRWVARAAPSPMEVLRVLVDAGRGIAAAHERGLVHRDIKPSNIMVGRDSRPRVVDFGLARAGVSDAGSAPGTRVDMKLTRTRALLGTPAYAAPEQLEGREADAKSDQFSFAATAWETLTRRAPFLGDSVEERLLAIRGGILPSQHGLPRRVLQPLCRALRAEPDERYPSMRALIEALDGAKGAFHARRRVRGAVGLGAGLACVALAVWAYRDRAHPRDETPASGSSLLARGSVLACPVFEAQGVEPPSAWLGAAAANLACRRASWLLGGMDEKILSPAQLLDFPRQPVDDLPADAWAASEVRGRTLEAAKSRATALLNGRVERSRDGFEVTLALEHPTGLALATRKGTAPELVVAVRRAMEQLESASALPIAAELDPEVRRWTGVKSAAAGAMLGELGHALETSADAKSPCRALEPLAPELGSALIGARAACEASAGVIGRSKVVLDRSSPEALAATAPAYFDVQGRGGRVDGAREIASELRRVRQGEESTVARRELLWAEANLWLNAGENDRASEALLDLADQSPLKWGVYGLLLRGTTGRGGRAVRSSRADIAWNPESPSAWAALSSAHPPDCEEVALDCVLPPERIVFQRRAVDLAPTVPLYSMHLALRLLEAGKVTETRSLGARFAGPPGKNAAAAYILGLADAKEGWLARGLDRMRRELGAVEALSLEASLSLVIQMLRLAEVLGKREEAARDVVERFVLSARPLPDTWEAVVPLIVACMHAKGDVAASCLARIRKERSEAGRWPGVAQGTEELCRGAERFAKGDVRGATEAWRGFALAEGFWILLPPEVFDATNNIEIATKIDRIHLRMNGYYSGIHPAWAREAKRAFERGDRARARKLAQRVVDSWSTADATVPAVAEMRALLAR